MQNLKVSSLMNLPLSRNFEQFSYLLFLKRLDDRENAAERQAKRRAAVGGDSASRPYQPSVKREMRWGYWTQMKAEEALSHLKNVVFPGLVELADEKSSFGEYMKGPQCKINKAGLLIKACNLIDQMKIAEQNQDLRQGDLYEYMLGHMQFAGRGGQLCMLLSLQEELAGVVARVESLRGRMGESARQVEGLFESLLAESFGG
jgi:hypothetical protein